MDEDKEGYALAMNHNCQFIALTEQQRVKWSGYYKAIQAFRNGAIHHLEAKPMNPKFEKIRDPEDSTQDYYRFAPYPRLVNDRGNQSFTENELRGIHQFIKPAILDIVRSDYSTNIGIAQADYEFYHVERGLFVDLLLKKTAELFKEAKILQS